MYIFIIIFISIFFNTYAYAVDLDKIIEQSNQSLYYKGDSFKSDIEVINKIDDINKNKKELLLIRKDNKDDKSQKKYIKFLSPIDAKETKLLSDNYNIKIFLPVFNLSKNLNPNDNYKSFFGTSFSYQDIIGFDHLKYNKSLLKNAGSEYIIKLTPKTPNDKLQYFISYINKVNLMPVKIEYFDKGNKKYREKTIEEIKIVNGYRTATELKAVDYDKNQTSTLYLYNSEYDEIFSDNIFILD